MDDLIKILSQKNNRNERRIFFKQWRKKLFESKPWGEVNKLVTKAEPFVNFVKQELRKKRNK